MTGQTHRLLGPDAGQRGGPVLRLGVPAQENLNRGSDLGQVAGHPVGAATVRGGKGVVDNRPRHHRRQAQRPKAQPDIRVVQIEPIGLVKAADGQNCVAPKGAIRATV